MFCLVLHFFRFLEMAFLDYSRLDSWSKSTIASALLALCIIYSFGVAIHRLYFSRYAKFPGPKLAALTYGYMFYYDVLAGDGQYMYKIKDLHEEYSKWPGSVLALLSWS